MYMNERTGAVDASEIVVWEEPSLRSGDRRWLFGVHRFRAAGIGGTGERERCHPSQGRGEP